MFLDKVIVVVLGVFGMISSLEAKKLIVSCPHQDIPLQVEIPTNQDELAKGLMYRTELAEDAGMLFIFPENTLVRMWMKNTILPLDMLFADKDGRILKIFENTVPYSVETIGPIDGTTQVLEINAGLSKKHGLTTACYLRNHS